MSIFDSTPVIRGNSHVLSLFVYRLNKISAVLKDRFSLTNKKLSEYGDKFT